MIYNKEVRASYNVHQISELKDNNFDIKKPHTNIFSTYYFLYVSTSC